MNTSRTTLWILRGLSAAGLVLVTWTIWIVFWIAPWDAPPADERSQVTRHPALPSWPDDLLAVDPPAEDVVSLARRTVETGHGILRCPVDLPDGLWLVQHGGTAWTSRITDGELLTSIPSGPGAAKLWNPRIGQAELSWEEADFLTITSACTAQLRTGVARIRGRVVDADGEPLVMRRDWEDLRIRGCGGLAVRPAGGEFVVRVPSGPCSLRVDREVEQKRAEGQPVALELLPNAWQQDIVLVAPTHTPEPLPSPESPPGAEARERDFEAWAASRQ